jgi:hypothetical protein
MGRVERETGNVSVDGNPPGQHSGQINLAVGFVYVVDHDRHGPVPSKGSGLGVNFLAWRSRTFGHNRARLGIPPESIIGGFGEETPNPFDWGVYGGKGADANAHSLIFLRALCRAPYSFAPFANEWVTEHSPSPNCLQSSRVKSQVSKTETWGTRPQTGQPVYKISSINPHDQSVYPRHRIQSAL